MSTTAARYAAALHAAGCPSASLRETSDYLIGCTPLWEALVSPAVEVREKHAVLDRLPILGGNENLLHFYKLLSDKGRFPLLPEIIEEYRLLELQEKNETVCVLRCARDPGDQKLAALAKALCKKHACTAITFEIMIDPAVLGGFVFEIDGVTYDKSVSGQLNALARNL